MSDVYIDFTFIKGEETCTEQQDFEGTSGVLGYVTDYAEEWCEERNDDLEDDEFEWECEEWTISSTDTEHTEEADAEDFGDLDEWGDYCDLVAEHGEAYCMRYADVGEHDFDDEYSGCWSSEEEFAEHLFDECTDCPSHLRSYIDMESYARDVMMDYSSYEGYEGFHIFRS